MKVLLVLVFALFAVSVAAALVYDETAITAGLSAIAAQVVTGASEPAAMLLSGSALLGLAGALRRLTC